MSDPLLYFVRHCQATGQEPDAALTLEGKKQAENLAEFLSPLGARRIVSSSFDRAVLSAKPFSAVAGLDIEENDDLVEHELRLSGFSDWRDAVKASFANLDLTEGGSESSLEARSRGKAVVDQILKDAVLPTVVFTHGKLLTLILGAFSSEFGYESWSQMTNPDVFELRIDGENAQVARLWG